MRWLLLVLLALLLGACARPALVTQEAYVFGTRVELVVWDIPEGEAHAALGEVLREFDRLHRAYHAWQPSELTALNDALAAGRAHEVSAELAALIDTARQLAERSNYLFDPAVGRLVALWGFHAEEFKPALPDPQALETLVAAKPSSADLVIEGNTIRTGNPAVALDFGGYLKGVALDRAAALLKARGIHNALINIGGNVMALGRKGDTPWRVGLQHPRATLTGNAPLATLELRDGEAIGTSGDYQRYFEVDGRRYCHLIDPRSGAPAQDTQALTVLVTAGHDGYGAGMLSDVLTKPLFIAGARWPELAQRLGVAHALRVDAQGRIFVTAALQARLHFTMDNLPINLVK